MGFPRFQFRLSTNDIHTSPPSHHFRHVRNVINLDKVAIRYSLLYFVEGAAVIVGSQISCNSVSAV